MQRTPLKERLLPSYTKAEEIFNTVSHIVGAGFGIIALVLSVIVASIYSDGFGIVSAAIYGGSMVILYTMSSIYHGLPIGTAKKIFQILDHCTIFLLIAGSYSPILLTAIREYSPLVAWLLFGFVWGLSALGITFCAIDIKKYEKLSMVFYILLGWCIVFAAPVAIKALSRGALLWLLSGGIAYTVGAVLYGIGNKKRFFHSVFHIFVVLGSILQFFAILIVLF